MHTVNDAPKISKPPCPRRGIVVAVGLVLGACTGGTDAASTRQVDTSADERVDTSAPVISIETAEGDQPDLTCGSDPEPGEALALVDIGANETVESIGGVSPSEALEASGITTVPIPTGGVEVVDHSRSYSSTAPETFTAYEQIGFAVATATPLDEVLTAIVESVEVSFDVEFVATDLTSDDGSRSVRLDPAEAGVDYPFYEIAVSDEVFPGVLADVTDGLVSLRIFANTEHSGPLPDVNGDAPGCRGTLSTASDLGWTLDRWKSTTNIVDEREDPWAFLALDWTVGPGDIADAADDLADRLTEPTTSREFDDRRVYTTADDAIWSVIVDPAASEGELQATYRVTF